VHPPLRQAKIEGGPPRSPVQSQSANSRVRSAYDLERSRTQAAGLAVREELQTEVLNRDGPLCQGSSKVGPGRFPLCLAESVCRACRPKREPPQDWLSIAEFTSPARPPTQPMNPVCTLR